MARLRDEIRCRLRPRESVGGGKGIRLFKKKSRKYSDDKEMNKICKYK